MTATTLLDQKPSVSVSDIVALGVSRHKARHDLEALVESGLALKVTDGRTVTYTKIVTAADAATDLTVLTALRPRKALSVTSIAHRTKMPPADVRQALLHLADRGLACRPFRSLRFRRV